MNSVDKNEDGDYMISSRYTDCIYKISGKDGSVIWRLGGKKTSFVQEGGFNFSRQHDARFIRSDKSRGIEIISLLDNASDGVYSTSSYSSALIIELNSSAIPMTAKVVRRWVRPDNELSPLRGNFQMLPNGNAFVGWSANSYISEHTYDGNLIMEAQFKSHRFVTYRAYKFNFTGTPTEPPALKIYVWGEAPETSTTVAYVSWNGATAVATWEFYRADAFNHGIDELAAENLLGSMEKKGFETVFQYTGYAAEVYAVARASDGKILGRSEVFVTIVPDTWESKGTQTMNMPGVKDEL